MTAERVEELLVMHAEAERFFASQVSRSWVAAYLEERGLAGAQASSAQLPTPGLRSSDHLRRLGP